MTDDVLPPESDIPANTDTVLDIDAAAPESDGADAASTPDPGSLPLSSETFTPSGPVPADLRQVVEALIFASSKALTARQLLNILTRSNETHGADFHLFKEVTEDQILDVIVQLKEEYATAVPSRGLHLQQIAGGFRFGTRPETATWVRQLFDETRPAKLSQPALETLSIIAYRQPISAPMSRPSAASPSTASSRPSSSAASSSSPGAPRLRAAPCSTRRPPSSSKPSA